MKKVFLFIGLFILTLPAILTSCDDDEPICEPQINNAICIGDVVSPITSISNETENNDTYIVVNTETMELTLQFKNQNEIPVGTFKLTLDGNNTGELVMIWSGIEYDLTGNISISLSNNIYVIDVWGNAFNDVYSYIPFTLNYQGMINNN